MSCSLYHVYVSNKGIKTSRYKFVTWVLYKLALLSV